MDYQPHFIYVSLKLKIFIKWMKNLSEISTNKFHNCHISLQSKPEYLAKVSEKLLADLASLDDTADQMTAVTRVEIERIEDVTDIVKTYRIGEAAPKEEVPEEVKNEQKNVRTI